MATKRKAIVLVLLSTLFASSGQLLVKMGADRLSFDVGSLVTNLPLLFGYVLYGVGAALLVLSLRHGELSVLYPIYALNFIWVSITSPLVFPEDAMNPVKWLGVLLVVAGVSVIGRGSEGGGVL